MIDLERKMNDKIQLTSPMLDQFMLCSQQADLSVSRYQSSAHIGVSRHRIGIFLNILC